MKKAKSQRSNDGHGPSGLIQPKKKVLANKTSKPMPKSLGKIDDNKGNSFVGPSRLTKCK